MVSGPFGGAAAPSTRLAEREPDLGIAVAFQAFAVGLALGRPFFGTGVFGLTRLGAPDALDAGGAAPLRAEPVRGASLAAARPARGAAFGGSEPTASGAKAGFGASLRASALTLAVRLAACVGVAVRHETVSTSSMGAGPSAGRRNA